MVLEVDLCQRDRPTAIGPLSSADVAVSAEFLPSLFSLLFRDLITRDSRWRREKKNLKPRESGQETHGKRKTPTEKEPREERESFWLRFDVRQSVSNGYSREKESDNTAIQSRGCIRQNRMMDADPIAAPRRWWQALPSSSSSHPSIVYTNA